MKTGQSENLWINFIEEGSKSQETGMNLFRNSETMMLGKKFLFMVEEELLNLNNKTVTKVASRSLPTTKAVVARSSYKIVTQISSVRTPLQVDPKLPHLKMLPRELRSMTLVYLEPRNLQSACRVNEFAPICSDKYFQKNTLNIGIQEITT
jgi:hypothetical protein